MARSFNRVVTTPAAARSAQSSNRPFVSLTSDWGLRDPSPAICRGVVLNIAPDALIVDVTHEVEKYNIRHGALMLWSALPYLPVGAHVCVIDPGVGTARRPIVIETGRGDFLVGPDNGVLIPGAERVGGISRVHVIDNAQYRLPVISATFHGRDLFTPTAAHLALGVQLEEIGPVVDATELVMFDWPPVVVRAGTVQTQVIYRDTFGNVKLAGLASDLQAAFPELTPGDELKVTIGSSDGKQAKPISMTWAHTFGEARMGDYVVLEDSYGRLCLAQSQGDAVRTLGIDADASVRIERA